MPIKIRKMTEDEFSYVYQWSVEQNTKELMKELHMSEEEAVKETVEEVSRMLPIGLETPDNYLMSIVESDSGKVVGFIWTLHELTAGRKQNFICDLAVWESEHRKGYGEAAIYLTEKKAAEAGCQEVVLFVNDNNHAAKALYRKCGFEVLRQENYGKYMIKRLDK